MISKDFGLKLSAADRAAMQMVLDNPLVWAEAIFPPRVVLDHYTDSDGVTHEYNRVAEGWLTRPWQQEILETKGQKKVVRVSRRAGKTLLAIVKCLHTAFVLGRGVLVFTPMERQVTEIYETMHAMFMDLRPDLFNKASVETDTKSPYRLKFSNGGFINFITAGTKSGGKGDSARGQGRGVKLIYIDEADYMSDADLDAILAISVQDPGMEVILTSTPTGKRNKFYQLCTGKIKGWTAFHKNAKAAIPNFTESGMEEEMRALYSTDAYQREFEAEFGEEVQGVFDKESIERAMERGKDDFPFMTRSASGKLIPESIKSPAVAKEEGKGSFGFGYARSMEADKTVHRIVGVDWDKYGAGTNILVIEARRSLVSRDDAYSRAMGQPYDYIRVVHRREIPKSEFTLDNAVRALVKMNHEFRPDFYYMDAGYGEHQIEAMVRLGMECKDPQDPAYGMHKKIVRVNFSEGVESLDPASKKLRKVRIKPEMVNHLVNKFDADEIVLSPFDIDLQRQLENYIVEKITASGEPKYTSVNEHIVDALMLAVWGLYCEFGTKVVSSVNQAHIDGPIGEKYMAQRAALERENGSLRRPDYLKPLDDVDRDNIEDELRFAKSGMVRADKVVTTPGDPSNANRARNDQSTFFHRGGRGWTPRRSF